MLFKNFADLVKVTQATIESFFGLSAKLGPAYCPDKAYKPLCKSLGVGLFGVELTLYSPTSKPVLKLTLSWSFETGAPESEDEDEPSMGARWHPSMTQSMNFSQAMPPLDADTNLRSVELSVNYTEKARPMDLTDLRCLLREKLKEAFPKVTLQLTG